MKKLLVFLILSLSFYSCFGQSPFSRRVMDDPRLQGQKLSQFYRFLTDNYIDTIDNITTVETAIKAMLAELDPHSAYFSAEDMVEVSESFDGSFSGIGIQFSILNDTLLVANTIPGGPSEKVGLQPNDRIINVDGQSIIGISQNQVLKTLRGPKGSVVNIEVLRHGVTQLLAFRIVRDDIPIYTVDAAYNVSPTTGYIKVNRFAHTTMEEFASGIVSMGNIDELIVDLRGNGGGLMNQSIEMSGFFLPRGTVVVSTEGRKTAPQQYKNPLNGPWQQGRVIVLIDEFSASASEIVAGALQDWDRAVIVGRRSFGKGLVQRQFPLVDGSAVNITISKYLTPTGRAIQRPFEKGNKDAYYESLVERLTKGFMDSLEADGMSYRTLRLGKTVYGGGGIYPDFYVHSDTTRYSTYWSELIRKGVINEFVNIYLDENRNTLTSTYPDFETFEINFSVDEKIIKQLTDIGESRGIPRDEEGLNKIAQPLEVRLKALIAQRLWSTTEYYRIVNGQDDEDFAKAMEIFRNWDTMATGIATDSI